VLREMREEPELDLGIVGGEELPVVGSRKEREPDLLPGFRADRDVLQVRVAGREPAGRGDGLIERGMDPAGLAHVMGKRQDVGWDQLAHGAVLEDLAADLDRLELLEDLLARRPSGLRLLGLVAGLLVHLELVEEELAELLRAVRIEVGAGRLANQLLEALD